MGQVYSAAERARAMALMQESARKSKDNTPNFTRISAETAISRDTLRRWWRESGGDAEPEEEPAPALAPESRPGTYGEEDLAWASEQLGIDERSDRDVRLVAGLLVERNSTTAATARAQATKLLVDTVKDLRRPRQERGGVIDVTAPPGEIVAALVAMPELVLEAWLASSELWADPRWVAVRGEG